jgi:hypothetical protein
MSRKSMVQQHSIVTNTPLRAQVVGVTTPGETESNQIEIIPTWRVRERRRSKHPCASREPPSSPSPRTASRPKSTYSPGF